MFLIMEQLVVLFCYTIFKEFIILIWFMENYFHRVLLHSKNVTACITSQSTACDSVSASKEKFDTKMGPKGKLKKGLNYMRCSQMDTQRC